MLRGRALLALVVLAAGCRLSAGHTIAVDRSYRVFVGKDEDPVWRSEPARDALAQKGFAMLPVTGGQLDAPAAHVDTPLGRLSLHAHPRLYKADLYQAYHIPTVWPYCEGRQACTVFSQRGETDPAAPLVLALPRGVGAADLFLDIAIDCSSVLGLEVVCEATAQPGGVVLATQLKSFCGSPFVSSYFGFYSERPGGELRNVSITCGSPFARALGMLRVGAPLPGAAGAGAGADEGGARVPVDGS